MPRYFKKRSQSAGMMPGSLVYLGAKRKGSVKIHVIDYNEQDCHRRNLDSVEECGQFIGTDTVTWINVDGVHQVDVVEKIGKQFGLHKLLLEDALNTGHRPKVEPFQNCLFIILKMLTWNEERSKIISEHVSIVLGQDYVISFQEDIAGDAFDPVRKRIEKNIGRIRRVGADYLAYALMDAVVDNYFYILEKLGTEVEKLQDRVMENPDRETLSQIYHLKREMIFLRKAIWPLREVMSAFQRREYGLIQEDTYKYLRDLYDHVFQVLDAVETYREMVAGMMDIYLSTVSNKMNSEMKILSVVATVFIPLTFIAGIYGMNFKNMPELEYSWGYPLILGIMVTVAIGMLLFFKRKDWF